MQKEQKSGKSHDGIVIGAPLRVSMFQCKSGKGELEADLNAGLSCYYRHMQNICPLE